MENPRFIHFLKAAQCTPDTPPLPRQARHHERVARGLDFIHREEKNTGGSLGRKSGVKHLVYTRLDRFCKDNANTLFVTDALKKAVDDILKHPLQSFAKETLRHHLKSENVGDQQLADLVASLREDGKLVVANDSPESLNREPQIICSLGLKNT